MTIILKPLLILLMVSYFGYKEKPAFLTALSLGQASEFSLILFVMGLSLGHITGKLFSAVILVTIASMALTPYLIKYEKGIYKALSKYMGFIKEVGEQGKLEYVPKKIKKDVILVGYDRLAYSIFKTLKKLKHKFLVVDYNPEVIKKLISKKIPCIYGDIGDLEILNRLDLKDAKMIISTIPDKEDSLTLIRKAKKVNRSVMMIVTASDVDDALDMYNAGAHYVILPHFLGGERVSLMLEEVKGNGKKLLNHKLKHLRELRERRKLKHRHPKRRRHR
jgi:voltage-gated potassium channel Kch